MIERGFIRRGAALLALVIFTGYFVSITAFPHAHKIDGKIVTHSHPFSNSSHSHSDSAFCLICQLSSFTSLAVSAAIFIKVFVGLSVRLLDKPCTSLFSRATDLYPLRGPPAGLN